MKYIIIPFYYLVGSVLWFVTSWLGWIIQGIVTLDFSKPKYKLKFWHNGNQVLTDVEFDSPWEWAYLSFKNLFNL